MNPSITYVNTCNDVPETCLMLPIDVNNPVEVLMLMFMW